MPISYLNPPTVAPPTNAAFTHVVSVSGGTTVYLAGQVGVDVSGKLAGPDLAAQTRQVFENIKACLAGAGATWENVIKTTIYIVNYTPAARATLGEVRPAYMPQDPPASTLIGVQAPAAPEYLIEIEATAYIP